MIYLSGVVRPMFKHPNIGFMRTPLMGNALPPERPWGADNGRFAAPQKYSDAGFLGWLSDEDNSRCLFATAPDCLCDHEATINLSLPLLPKIRGLGYPAAFVAQNGWTDATTPWDDFDVLFIGGDDIFKLGKGADAIMRARQRGKRVHMGRVNSYKRLRLAAVLGCHSVDGTFLKFAPDINEPRMMRWIDQMLESPTLPLGDAHVI